MSTYMIFLIFLTAFGLMSPTPNSSDCELKFLLQYKAYVWYYNTYDAAQFKLYTHVCIHACACTNVCVHACAYKLQNLANTCTHTCDFGVPTCTSEYMRHTRDAHHELMLNLLHYTTHVMYKYSYYCCKQ